MPVKSMGTTFTFTPAGGEAVTVGKLSAVSEISCGSELIDVTTLEDGGGRRYMQGVRDSGEIRLNGFHTKGDAGQQALRAAWQSGEEGTAQIRFPDGVTARFAALVRAFSLGAATVNGAVAFACTLRVNGAIAWEEA